MSKHSKVNPGTYTQAGRLSPDDSARELKKQREPAAPPMRERAAHSHTPAPDSHDQRASRVTDEDNQDTERSGEKKPDQTEE